MTRKKRFKKKSRNGTEKREEMKKREKGKGKREEYEAVVSRIKA